MKKNWKLWLLCVSICLGWIGLSQILVVPWKGSDVFLGLDGAVSFLEEKTVDARLEFRGPVPCPVKLCYVNVDTDSISTLGNFPWNRAIFAQVLNALFERGNVRAVGMDFVFSSSGLPQLGHEEAEAGNLALGKSVQKNRNVVLAATYGTQTGMLGKANRSFPFLFDTRTKLSETDLPEMPGFPVVGPTWGHVGLIDADGTKLRWIPAFAPTEFKTYFTLALQLARLYYGLDESGVQIEPDRILLKNSGGEVLAGIPLKLRQIVEPNWFSDWDSKENPTAGVASVLEFDRLAREGTEQEKQQAAEFFGFFRDAVVLIGPTDPLLQDISPSPMSGSQPVPRVSIHGNLFKTIVSGQSIIRPPAWVNSLLILGIGLGAAFLSVLRNQLSGPGKLFAAALTVGYVAATFFIFSNQRILLPVVAPIGAALSCTFLAVLRQLTIEDQQRRRIKQLFGSYVSSTVVNEMVERNAPPQTGGAEVEITAFFSDIVSFSPLSEQLSAADLVRLMCHYLGECTAAIIEQEGTLDKYVGDAIIAMFGTPLICKDHAAAACRAAIGLQAAQARLRDQWKTEARWPDAALRMQTRVGLHTGMAVVGNIGSELRFNYTMMGDTVNLAQRVEAAASHYGVSILVSGDTQEAAASSNHSLVFRPLDRVLVPGRSNPVEIFELLGSGEEIRKSHGESLARYESARKLYTQGAWTAAREAFLLAESADPSRRAKSPASVMAARCEKLASRPPVENLAFPLTKESNSI